MKNNRQENVHTDIFTPRAYQVELLDAALQRNTIVCLGSGTGKTFIGVMLIKELAHQVRDAPCDGGKRTVYLVHIDAAVESQAKVIRMHTDLQVGEYTKNAQIDSWGLQEWEREFNQNQVLVMSAQIFLDTLTNNYLNLKHMNLLAFDECHYAVDDHPYVQIMEFHDACPQNCSPRVLGLTASVLANTCHSPVQLEKTITSLEHTLRSTAETASDMIITDLYSARPKEIVLTCDEYVDHTGLVGELNESLMKAIDFLQDLVVEYDKEGGEKDPRVIPKTVLIECHNILHVLGPWCAGKIAETIAKQLTKLVEHEKKETHKRLLQMALTQLNMIEHFVNVLYDTYVQTIEDFLTFMSPRVLKLIDILHEYKPDDNFMIIGGDNFMDLGSDSDDSLNLSDEEIISDEEDEKGRKGKGSKAAPPYVAVKCVAPEKEKEDDSLCGIVFVRRRHTAYALNALIVELCNWDLDLFFVKSHHITGHGVINSGKESEMMFKYQEDILRQFRHRDINLLISTSVLEEGVDVPKCNLIIRFDLPSDYRSYVQSKGRARAPKSKYCMLVEEEDYERFSADLSIFKRIESILMSKCHSRDDHVEEEEASTPPDAALPPYMPSQEDEAPKVTMTSAIALVNKYCAKLPSDAFTHLTPKCHVEQISNGDKPLYQATLQLPINSPIKKPVKGELMPSRKLAKMAVALKTSEILHRAGELDNNLLPVGKEMIKYEDDENEWEDHELAGQARPGTTKRKQYYQKKIADALVGRTKVNKRCYLYYFEMNLTCPITEEQNTRGRKIHSPDETPRGFGILSPNIIPLVPRFPVFTRSGEITISVDLVNDNVFYTEDDLPKFNHFHRFVFSRVLRLEKDPMSFNYENAESSYIIVPVTRGDNDKISIDWDFINKIEKSPLKTTKRKHLYDPANKKEQFQFKDKDFEDAVVMPSYRNIDQPQYFYVAEIRNDLNPKCPFPSPELYDTFEHYYTSKYGLEITNLQQPLLDVDHTSARLNLLTPRYMNQKGVALPTSSAETRRARRENLQQKQILIPELCDIHPFPASLWRKAVCLPAILYRLNYLLIAEELRVMIAEEAHIGIVQVGTAFRFQDLEFGFSTKPGAGASDEKIGKSETNDGVAAAEETSNDSGHNNKEEKTDEETSTEMKPETNDESSENRLIAKHSDSQRESVLVGKLCENSHPDEPVDSPQDTTDATNPAVPNHISEHNDQESKNLKSNLSEVSKSFKKLEINSTLPLKNGIHESIDEKKLRSLNNCSIDKLSQDSTETVSKDDLNKASTVILGDGDKDISQELTNAKLIPATSLEQQGGNLSTSNLMNGHAEASQSGTDSDSKEIVPQSQSEANVDEEEKDVSETSINEKVPDSIEDDDILPCIRFDQETDLKTFVGPSPCTILQTMTMSNANDFFNLERLETIGDSFLKFAITVYLYCTYPGIHEGKLSYLRSKQVSNYNLYKLGKKKSFPDCMVAAKFEPTENWLPPGYVIKKDGAFKGLSVRIASKMRKPIKDDESSRESSTEKDTTIQSNGEKVEDSATVEAELPQAESTEDMQKRFNRELFEATNMDEERTDPQELMKSLIPYNLQTQHSLPDKSIADCVEALIGCYLTTCGQRAALQFMSWLGLKVLPDGDEDDTTTVHHGNNLRDILQGNSIKIGFPNGSRNKTVGFGKLQPPLSPLLVHVPNAHGILEYYLDGYDAFEERIKYKFNDRSYLLQAFTHASYHYNTVTDCYQRLEFLGDAILDYVITRHLFEDSQKHSPGVLTDLRSALVNNNIFAALAVKWDFHKYFRAVSPQLFSVIDKFVSWQKDNLDKIYLEEEIEEGDEDLDGYDDIEDIEIPKALGDIFESVAGAIYLDSGMSLDIVWRVYYRMMKPQIDAFTEKIPKSPVRELLEMEPETAKFEKPERTLDGKIRVTVNVVGKGSFRGIGRNYRIAKSAAAKRALKVIKSLPNLGAVDQSRQCNCPCQRMQQQIQMHMHPH